MKVQLVPAAALSLAFAAAPAFGQGADGPQFPNLYPVTAATQPAGQAPAIEATAQASDLKGRVRSAPTTADGSVVALPAFMRDDAHPRATIKSDTVQANRAGQLGHATTPY